MMSYQTLVVVKRSLTVYRQTGFTLLELMIVVAIAGIVMAIGVPSFQSITTNNRIAANTNEFITALNLARSEAVKRGAAVSVCKSADGATCTTSGDWDQGWIVIVVGDTDPLRVFESLGGNTTLTSAGNLVTFNALGALSHAAVSFELEVKSGSITRNSCLTVTVVGRAGKAPCS